MTNSINMNQIPANRDTVDRVDGVQATQDATLFGNLLAGSLNTDTQAVSATEFARAFTEQFLSQRGVETGVINSIMNQLDLMNDSSAAEDSLSFMQAAIDLVSTISKNIPETILVDFSAELLRQKEELNQQDGQTLL